MTAGRMFTERGPAARQIFTSIMDNDHPPVSYFNILKQETDNQLCLALIGATCVKGGGGGGGGGDLGCGG